MKIIAAILLIFIVILESHGQVVDFGGALRSVKFSEQSSTSDYSGSFTSFDALIGVSAPLFTISNDFDMGIYTYAAIGTPFASSSSNARIDLGQTIHLSVPLYITFGYGPGTKKGNNRKIGIKTGVGYQLTATFLPNYVDSYYAYLHPQIMAELTYKTKKTSAISHFKLRYERQISSWDRAGYFDLGKNSGGLWFNQQSLSLTFVFSKNKRRETRVFDLSN